MISAMGERIGGPGDVRSSLHKTQDRAGEIAKLNHDLKGFPSVFARFPEDEQKRIIRQVNDWRKEYPKNPEMVLERVRGLAQFYGSLAERIESESGEDVKAAPLTAPLGEISRTLSAMAGVEDSAEDQETVH